VVFLPESIGPACNWDHLSWTYLDEQEVMKKFTASNDQQTNTQSKSCAAGELDEQDLRARGSALYGRVA
jgi:hypothetical protein